VAAGVAVRRYDYLDQAFMMILGLSHAGQFGETERTANRADTSPAKQPHIMDPRGTFD
jgi:hypothetical protein